MEYRAATTGRVFIVRFDHGEDFLAGLRDLVRMENVRCAWYQAFGGLAEADVVIGPREPTMPPDPVWRQIRHTMEVAATGSIFWDGDRPLIHTHAAMGHHGDTVTGCVRENTKVYLLLEVIVHEILGVEASRPWFEAGGFNRVSFA